MGNLRVKSRVPLLQVLKTSLAAVLAWFAASALLGQALPIFAAIAALLVVQPSINQSLARGIERSLGVVLGVIVASVAHLFFGTSSWIVLGVVVVSLLIGWALRLGTASSTQIPISGMLMLSIGVATPNYAFDRILETVIGAVVAMIVNVAIAPPVLLAPAHAAVRRSLKETAATLDALSGVLLQPRDESDLQSLMATARSLRTLDSAAAAALATAEESLMLNPRRGNHRRVLRKDAELQARLSILARRLVGMARAVHDHYDESLHSEPIVQDLAREMVRAAHDLRLLGADNDFVLQLAPTGDEEPALTAPLRIPRPHPTHWVLIGSLMEDMRRVREEIIGSSD